MQQPYLGDITSLTNFPRINMGCAAIYINYVNGSSDRLCGVIVGIKGGENKQLIPITMPYLYLLDEQDTNEDIAKDIALAFDPFVDHLLGDVFIFRDSVYHSSIHISF